MDERQAYVTISYFASWTPEDLGLPSDVSEQVFQEAIEEAITNLLNCGSLMDNSPDEITTEICGFEKGFENYDL